MNNKPIELAIVLPCLNEGNNLKELLPNIRQVLSEINATSEIYVVDGGSVDDTVETAATHGAIVLHQRGKGYGGAIKTAFEDISATWLLTMDADFSHHPVFIKYLFERRHEAEIIIASRYVKQGYADMPFSRKLLSATLNWVFGVLLDLNVRDLSSGFRLYHRKAVSRLVLTYTTYAVLQEILVKAHFEGYRVVEEPFHYLPRKHGSSHARVIQFGIVYMKALWHLWALRNSNESADYETRAFYSRMPLQRWWQRKRYKIIRTFSEDRMRVVDIGCGSSQLLNGIPQSTGVDIHHRKLRFMRRTARKLVVGNATTLPFPNGIFDVVICSQVIEHVQEYPLVFKEAARCLVPGGILIVGTPDYSRWLWRAIKMGYTLFRLYERIPQPMVRYTPQLLEDHLDAAGFEIQSHVYIAGAELIVKAVKLETAT